MAPTRRNTEDILARVNFPLYTIQMLSNRHVIVGGGGGSSKTGVANGFEIFELSHDGRQFVCEEVTRHETGPSVVMNCSAFSDSRRSFLVAGQESHCQLYGVDCCLVREAEDDVETVGDSSSDLRHRKAQSRPKTDTNRNIRKRLKFNIKPMDSVQTDFKGPEPLLRVMRIGHAGKMLATGGTDNIVKLWKFPTMEPLATLKAHTKEIDDIDFSQHGNYLVTVAKDGEAILWDSLRGRELRRLKWNQPEGSRYLYKRCRFGLIEHETEQCALYTLANPTGVAGRQKSYLQAWRPDPGALTHRLEFDESLSALAVRDDGRFLAVGTMFSGSVSIHVAFSLQRVLNIAGAHSMFVTGLEFLPVAKENHTAMSVAEAAVLSISVDNQVCIHTLPYRKTMPAWIGMLILVLTLFLTFIFCSYIGI